MSEFILFSEIVEANGKTIRENNLAKSHTIPLGTLVEVKFDSWFGDGACWKVHARLWVVLHQRDCDGTPLYGLSRWPEVEFAVSTAKDHLHLGFSEEQLAPVEITKALIDGHGALEWNR